MLDLKYVLKLRAYLGMQSALKGHLRQGFDNDFFQQFFLGRRLEELDKVAYSSSLLDMF